MTKNRDVEQDIIDAARKVFHQHGFKEATMRNIAEEANINMAMLHYYFRSKDNLFYIIFDESFRLLYEKITKIINNKNLDIFEIIRITVSEYITFSTTYPQLPPFIMGEIIRNPQKVGKRIKDTLNSDIIVNILSEKLREQYKMGMIRETSVYSLVLNIISLCVFPSLAKSVINEAVNVDPAITEIIIKTRRTEVSDFIINSIRI